MNSEDKTEYLMNVRRETMVGVNRLWTLENTPWSCFMKSKAVYLRYK